MFALGLFALIVIIRLYGVKTVVELYRFEQPAVRLALRLKAKATWLVNLVCLVITC